MESEGNERKGRVAAETVIHYKPVTFLIKYQVSKMKASSSKFPVHSGPSPLSAFLLAMALTVAVSNYTGIKKGILSLHVVIQRDN